MSSPDKAWLLAQAEEAERGGQAAKALDLLQHGADLFPGCHDFPALAGNLLLRQGQVPGAVYCYQQALRLAPDHAGIIFNMGNALLHLAGPDKAGICFRKVLDLTPDFAPAHASLGHCLMLSGQTEAAVRSFARANALDSGLALSELVLNRRNLADWTDFSTLLHRLEDQAAMGNPAVTPFSLIIASASPGLQQQAARAQMQPLHRAAPRPPMPALTDGKIRIGYLSADLHRHATAFLLSGVLEQHDRSRFSIHAYSFGPDDGSPERDRIRAACDHFNDIHSLTHDQAAQMIREDGIHILVDLKGHTAASRPEIVSRRPAPIQVNYLGFPGTMGSPVLDYLIADRIVAPLDHHCFYDEHLVHLPDCYQPNDNHRAIDPTPSRDQAGLPPTGFVFCVFNNPFKLTPDTFAIWMRLLRQVPESVLWFCQDSQPFMDNLRAQAQAAGVAGNRLVFSPRLPQAAHLARHRLADLFLDTQPCTAHTTASDALWAGLPVLTCLGGTFAGRVAASLLHAVGLPDLVARDMDEYEALALALARDPARLARLRARLDQARESAALFDTARYTRHLEAAFTQMIHLAQTGQQPRPITITPQGQVGN